MEPDQESAKSKKRLIVASFFAGIFLAGCIVLGYLSYSQFQINQSLNSEKNRIAYELSQLRAAVAEGNTAQIAKIAKALAYADFFGYMNEVTAVHDGYTGWTQAEFEHGRALAQATGDASFVMIVDEAWAHDTDLEIPRLLAVWQAIQQGIESALK